MSRRGSDERHGSTADVRPAAVVGPNPDLSLRFTTAPATRVVLPSGTTLSVDGGTATVAFEVRAGDQQLAQGLGSCLLPAE